MRYVAEVNVCVVLSVRPSVWDNSASAGKVFVKLLVAVPHKMCQGNSSFFNIGQENKTPYLKTCRN
jgi:hypothetical protein